MNPYGLQAQRHIIAMTNVPSVLMVEKKLTSKARKGLSASTFVYPGERRYPIPDRSHAANALSRSSGKSEQGKVKAAVCKKYPDMASCKGGGD